MTVLFDVTELLPRQLTPEGIYTKNLFRILRGLGVDIEPVFRAPGGIKDNFIETHINDNPKKFREFFAKKGSILFGPNSALLSESTKFKKVMSVNDLSMYQEGIVPSDIASSLQTHLKQQMQSDPEAVIVPTQTMHNEILVRFPKLVNKVHVIAPGSDHVSDNTNVATGRITEAPYFVFNGSLGKRGNITAVAKAFSALAQSNSEVKLVITGYSDYGSESIIRAIQKSQLSERIIIKDDVSPSLLKRIYSDAIALVIPSNYEAFSFPMVEAMRLGCPVIASSFGSVKDVAGEALHLVNPKYPEQIIGAMERVLVEKSYREQLVKTGHEIGNDLTWLKCGRDVVSVLNSI